MVEANSIKGVIRFAKAVRMNLGSETMAAAANTQDTVGIDIAYFLHMVGKGMRSLIATADMHAAEREIQTWNTTFREKCSMILPERLLHDADQMARLYSFAGELLQVAQADPQSIHDQIGIQNPINDTLKNIQAVARQSMQNTDEPIIRNIAAQGLESLLRHRSAAGGYAEFVQPSMASLPYEALIRLDVPADVRAAFEEKSARRETYHAILRTSPEITAKLHPQDVRKAAVHFANCHSVAKLHHNQIADTTQWEDVT